MKFKTNFAPKPEHHARFFAIHFAVAELARKQITKEKAESIIKEHIPEFSFDKYLSDICHIIAWKDANYKVAPTLTVFAYEHNEMVDQIADAYAEYLKSTLLGDSDLDPRLFDYQYFCIHITQLIDNESRVIRANDKDVTQYEF
ncbi:hypothetical protein HQ400_07770 [Aeromonas jandaei]|nr:hypothetical protein HQ400_07770 [Aeromonas jandaei]